MLIATYTYISVHICACVYFYVVVWAGQWEQDQAGISLAHEMTLSSKSFGRQSAGHALPSFGACVPWTHFTFSLYFLHGECGELPATSTGTSYAHIRISHAQDAYQIRLITLVCIYWYSYGHKLQLFSGSFLFFPYSFICGNCARRGHGSTSVYSVKVSVILWEAMRQAIRQTIRQAAREASYSTKQKQTSPHRATAALNPWHDPGSTVREAAENPADDYVVTVSAASIRHGGASSGAFWYSRWIESEKAGL